MAPLIPQGFINPDLSLFFAFVIGLGFGYVLEQGGFSTSRKLAGVFYGYDFVVLRVFFTAAITAAIGLLLFNYLGWVEYDMLYINPTFLWSAVVGGVIMGFGFILGGFCPGTSMVAAIIGKIDAMLFILGMMGGIFFFGAFYNAFEPLYNGSALGSIFVFDSLGMPRDLFLFLLVVIALAAFIITRKIEDKVNGIQTEKRLFHSSYTLPFAFMSGLALLILILPDQPEAKWYETDPKSLLKETVSGDRYMQPEELAYKILHPDENELVIVDVRPAEAFRQFRLPGAINIPLETIQSRENRRRLSNTGKEILLYSHGSTSADQAWMFLRRSGMENIRVLKGGLNNFFTGFFAEQEIPASGKYSEKEQFERRFIERAAKAFKEGEASRKAPAASQPVRTLINIQPPAAGKGGC